MLVYQFITIYKLHSTQFSTYTAKKTIYVFPETKLQCPVPNFHIHVSVNDLYSPNISPSTLLQQSRWTDRGNIYIADRHECRNLERGRAVSFLGLHKSDLLWCVYGLFEKAKKKMQYTISIIFWKLFIRLRHVSS